MHSFPKKLVCLLVLAAAVPSAMAFSLLGPYATNQTTQLGYRKTNDIGGPMFFHSFYRWNVPNIYYAYDQSFINYFGTNGMNAVDSAMAVLNSLPTSAALNINDYPLDSKLWNPLAEQAYLYDLKSYTLSVMLEMLGLADPERYAWTLYYRSANATVAQTNYFVIQMNYDPDTYMPTSAVNGVVYTYRIQEDANGNAEAIEVPVTYNDQVPYTSVAGGNLPPGYLYAGLTRDDAAGIKYLLSTNTLAVEGLLTNQIFLGSPALFSGLGWVPYLGTSNTAAGSNYFSPSNYFSYTVAGLTNGSNLIVTAVRGGVNKVQFHRVEYDSLLGNTFSNLIITNYYTDRLIITNKLGSQKVYRVVRQPDIVFMADHLGFIDRVDNGVLVTTPWLFNRTDTSGWINNDALNGQTVEGGPGVISGPIAVRFSSDLGGFYNSNPYYWDEQWSATGPFWASFDQTTNAITIYPVYQQITVSQLLKLINAYTNYTPGTLSSTKPK
jgi:hypothetical protein